jgi:hypothetical protein
LGSGTISYFIVNCCQMFKKQSIVSTLLSLGLVEDAKRVKDHDINEHIEDLKAKLSKLSEGKEAALIKNEVGDSQYDRIRNDLEADYDKALQRAGGLPTGDEASGAGEAVKKPDPEKAADEALAVAAKGYELRAVAEPERILDQIDDYRRRFYPDEDENTFEADFKLLEDLPVGGNRGKVSVQAEIIDIHSDGERLSFNLTNTGSVTSTPLGDFEIPGRLRPAAVKIHLSGDSDLDYGVYPVAQRELLTLLRGVAFVEIEADRNVERTAQKIGRWLDDAKIHVLEKPLQNKKLANKAWFAAAGCVRTSLLLLRHWRTRLMSELKATETWQSFLARRDMDIAEKEPDNLTATIKDIQADLEAEMSLYQSALNIRFDQRFKALKIRAGRKISNLGPAHIEEGEIDGDTKKKSLSIVDSQLKYIFLEQDIDSLKSFGNDLEARFQSLWDKFLYPRLIERRLNASLGQELDRNAVERIVNPVSVGQFEEITRRHLNESKEAVSKERYFGTTIKRPTMLQALAATARVPSRLLAPFAGIFALTMMLGLGSFRSAVGAGMDGLDLTTQALIWIIAALIVAFLVFVYMDANNQRSQDSTKFLVDAKKKISLAHESALEAIRKEYHSAFQSKLKSSLTDVLRRIRADVDIKAQETRAEWTKRRHSIREVDQELQTQRTELARIAASIEKSEEKLGKYLNNLKALADLKSA